MTSILRNTWDFVCEWYPIKEIKHGIERQLKPDYDGLHPIPEDVTSDEFAEWMAHQYRLAMRKGVELAVEEINIQRSAKVNNQSPLERPIRFEFEGESFEADMEFYKTNECQLPDGRIIEAIEWKEFHPPIPSKIREQRRKRGSAKSLTEHQ